MPIANIDENACAASAAATVTAATNAGAGCTKDVWTSRRDLSRKSSCESSTKSEISTDDWPSLSEAIDKVTKLALVDSKTPPVTPAVKESCNTVPTNQRNGRKGSSSPAGMESCSSINEEGSSADVWKVTESWGDTVPECGETAENGDKKMSRSNSTVMEAVESGPCPDGALVKVEEEPPSQPPADLGARRKSSKASKLKWIPLPLPDLPPLKQRTGRRPSKQRSDKIKNKPEGNGSIPNGGTGTGFPHAQPDSHNGRRKMSPKAAARASAGRNFTKSRRISAAPALSSSSSINGDFPDFGAIGSPPQPPRRRGTDFFMPYTWRSPEFLPPPPPHIDDVLLITLLRNQIEYYFGAENLSRDFFLRRKMDSEGYLPIHLIASFQRVQKLTTDIDKVIEAIQSSTTLEMRDGCLRTIFNPLRWPIIDNIPISPVALMSRSFSLPMPCAIGIGIGM